jgi:hypothetical protein
MATSVKPSEEILNEKVRPQRHSYMHHRAIDLANIPPTHARGNYALVLYANVASGTSVSPMPWLKRE